jgi:hypothetical protein
MIFVISPASSPFFVLCLSDYSRLFSLKASLFLCSLFDRLFSFSPFYTLQFDVQFYLLLLIVGDPYLVSLYSVYPVDDSYCTYVNIVVTVEVMCFFRPGLPPSTTRDPFLDPNRYRIPQSQENHVKNHINWSL